jgi:hypothetical protein
MAEDYDNNDRGAAFPPFQTQALVLQGKINDRGLDAKVVLIKDQTKAGKNLIEVYQKVGVLFPQEEKKSESAPDYTGPMDNGRRLAAWRKMKDGKPYMTMSLSDAQQQQQQADALSLPNDRIPF